MKKYMTVLAFIFTLSISAQNMMTQNSDNPKMEKWAKALTNKYSKELAMKEKQRLLFEKKLIEFKINDEEIRNSSKSTADKLAEIQLNYKRETQDMADILTQPQMDLYKELKIDYQPMEAVVVGEVED